MDLTPKSGGSALCGSFPSHTCLQHPGEGPRLDRYNDY